MYREVFLYGSFIFWQFFFLPNTSRQFPLRVFLRLIVCVHIIYLRVGIYYIRMYLYKLNAYWSFGFVKEMCRDKKKIQKRVPAVKSIVICSMNSEM